MSVIYLIALIAVTVALLAWIGEAVWSVPRKPAWDKPTSELTLVNKVERRKQSLPFVGRDRRRAAVKPQTATEVEKVAA